MPKLATPLTELKINRASPKAKTYRLADGGGLYLEVSPAGKKTWIVRYKLPGRTAHAAPTIGHYPGMTLAQARARAAEVRQAGKDGRETAGLRRAQRMVLNAAAEQQQAEAKAQVESERATFREVAKRWLAERKAMWSDATYRKARLIVDSYFNPAFGDRDVRTLQTKDVRPLLIDMAGKVPTLARKARQYAPKIMELAMDEGLRSEESALRLRSALPKVKSAHMPAVTEDQAKLGQVLRAIDAHSNRVVRAALMMVAYTGVRPHMAAEARWADIRQDEREWSIPAERMKTREPFTTPLSEQVMRMLADMQRLKSRDDEEFVFPPTAQQRNAHMHRDALSKALRDMGFRGLQTPHGFRATLRTMARERLNVDIDVLEAQLAHAPKDEVQAAYARAQFKEKRREVMQQWADFLDELRDGESNVVSIKRRA